jgi:tRNA(adenine34) deaminase
LRTPGVRGSRSRGPAPVAFGELAVPTKTKKAARGSRPNGSKHRWVASVKTDSTHPPEGLFNKSAPIIARTLASKKVSPKGPTSGLRMLTYFINRAGRGLPDERKATLQKAKEMLSKRIKVDKEKEAGV